jgi:hypothetical protein
VHAETPATSTTGIFSTRREGWCGFVRRSLLLVLRPAGCGSSDGSAGAASRSSLRSCSKAAVLAGLLDRHIVFAVFAAG